MLGLVPLACRRSIHVLDQILRGGTMPVSFSDLQLACEFVSSGDMGENEAYLDRQSGKIYWHSEFGDNDEELPDEIFVFREASGAIRLPIALTGNFDRSVKRSSRNSGAAA